jgi:hypothetical protein
MFEGAMFVEKSSLRTDSGSGVGWLAKNVSSWSQGPVLNEQLQAIGTSSKGSYIFCT